MALIPKGSLIVSCQADPGSPFAKPDFICAFAEAAVRSGAAALRLEGTENVKAVRHEQSVPIIGLVKKRQREFGDIYITPTLEDVQALCEAGADIIAFDATLRERPVSVERLSQACHELGKVALADISTVAEAEAAMAAGANLISTTLSGYTAYSPQLDAPDFELIKALAAKNLQPLAEGRIRTAQEAAQAVECGAYAVVVGSAITRPGVIASWFKQALDEMRGRI